MKKIAVYSEIDYSDNTITETSYEIISKAYELKKEAKKLNSEDNDIDIVAIMIGKEVNKASVQKLFEAGADWAVLIKNDSFNEFSQTVFSCTFVEYFNSNPFDMIIFPATMEGRMVAPRITTMLNTGLVADCTGLELIEKNGEIKLASTRPTFGAELMATIISKKKPECATIRPKTFKVSFDVPVDNDTISQKYYEYQTTSPFVETRMKLIRSLDIDNENAVDFSNAKVVLVAGYGLYAGKNHEYFDKLKKLASIVGASFGATRKVVDLGIVPREYQIGQTGSTVASNLYIAFGVSGAIQHITGMKNSKTIVSINTDKDAEIFKYSDYKIVEDAKKVIDELLKFLLSR